MLIQLSKLEKFFFIEKVIYHSLDLSLYQVSVLIDGENYYVTDNKDRFLRASSLVELQKKMSNVKSKESVLRQSSAYDEMIGLSNNSGSNTMEIPIRDNELY